MLAAAALHALGACDTKALANANVKAAVAQVAAALGNTPTICRKCYVHPALIETYLAGGLKLRRSARAGLSPHEAAVLAFVRRLTRKPLAARR